MILFHTQKTEIGWVDRRRKNAQKLRAYKKTKRHHRLVDFLI